MTAFPNDSTVAVKRLENSVWIFNHFQLPEGCKGLKDLTQMVKRAWRWLMALFCMSHVDDNNE